jgi:hypothetical protein
MNLKQTSFMLSLALVMLPTTAISSMAAVSCAPLVSVKVTQTPFLALNTALTPRLAALKKKLDAMKDQATYAPLLTEANAAAAAVTNGRIVLALPDGTVVVDTSKGALNTYANFSLKKINENHNSRIAFLDAQLFECGIGLETKRSTTTKTVETAVARRLGNYLDSSGTVRLSKK